MISSARASISKIRLCRLWCTESPVVHGVASGARSRQWCTESPVVHANESWPHALHMEGPQGAQEELFVSAGSSSKKRETSPSKRIHAPMKSDQNPKTCRNQRRLLERGERGFFARAASTMGRTKRRMNPKGMRKSQISTKKVCSISQSAKPGTMAKSKHADVDRRSR